MVMSQRTEWKGFVVCGQFIRVRIGMVALDSERRRSLVKLKIYGETLKVLEHFCVYRIEIV